MKIGHIDTKPPATMPVERKADAAPSKNTAAPSTEVALSAAATGAGDGDFDSAKVERITTAIREGKFTVNPGAIADKLIVNAEELLGRKLS